MENPFGHHRHHHRNDDEQPPPPPPYPPPFSYPPPPGPFASHVDQPPPPPPSQFSSYHDQLSTYPPHAGGAYQPPVYPPYGGSAYPPPAQTTSVYHNFHAGVDSHSYPPQSTAAYTQHEVHVVHESGAASGRVEEHHHYRPHMPSFISNHIHSFHGYQSDGGSISDLANKPSVRVYCKAETNHMLAIRDGKVILAGSDPNDPTQHWVKDEKYSTKVKDQDGFPSFALVNKATGQAMKHSIGATHPVQLIAYKSDVLDESILWTLSKDLGGGYRHIRMINNIRLVVDAFHGDKRHGGVHDGTTIVLWEPGKGDNQRWKMDPY